MTQSVCKIHARSPVTLIVNLVLRFPAHSIAQSQALAQLPVILVKQGGVKWRSPRRVLIIANDGDLIFLRCTGKICGSGLKSIGAVGAGVRVVGILIRSQPHAKIQAVPAFGSADVILKFVIVLVVPGGAAIVTAIDKRALHIYAGQGEMGRLAVVDTPILK